MLIGEIAVRIIRACREYGIETVAVYAKGDEQKLAETLSNIKLIRIGEANALDSYLNIDRIISAAQITGANAIHPKDMAFYQNQQNLLKPSRNKA
ncbi:biotin carboxylase N-terminal domain-containing protein [Staphylococcus aureus]